MTFFNKLCLGQHSVYAGTQPCSRVVAPATMSNPEGRNKRAGNKVMSRFQTALSVRSTNTRRLLAFGGITAYLLASLGCASAEEWPTFRKGVWQFERTLELNAKAGAADQNRVVSRHEMRRCVDPSESMKETFRPLSIGNCHPTKPKRLANKYVFSLRCDYMGPVKTTIEVLSDTAYTETNEVQVGDFPRTETVVAHRIAECP